MTADIEAQALREAVMGGDFTTAQQAALRFTSRVADAVPGLPPAESARRLCEACDLLAWSRRNLGASRARLAGEVRHLQKVRQYQSLLAEISTADRR